MKVTPFFMPGKNQHNTPMGIDYHLVPGVHVLFFGPVECARHTFPSLVSDPDGSLLVVNDVQASLGATEDLVREAVEEISSRDPNVRAFLLCTACQTAFMGIDLEGLCRDLHEETGLWFGHLEANRMAADNIPGHARKDVPGGDRYHSRLALFRMLRQVPPASVEADGEEGGVLVLTGDALDASNELLQLKQVPGVGWVRGVGDCRCFEDFLRFRDARITIATSMPWKEVGEWMHDEFGIPTLYLPTSYSIEEIDDYYGRLLPALRGMLGASAEEELREFDAVRLDAREKAQETVEHAVRKSFPLELDLRIVNRPFSTVEALSEYGFTIRDFLPSAMRVLHKEADDLPAYERLCARNPSVGIRFASRQKSSRRGKGHGSRTKNLQRAGRWVNVPNEGRAERVPEETAWWGYASISELMRQISAAENMAARGVGGKNTAGAGSRAARNSRKGKWSL